MDVVYFKKLMTKIYKYVFFSKIYWREVCLKN